MRMTPRLTPERPPVCREPDRVIWTTTLTTTARNVRIQCLERASERGYGAWPVCASRGRSWSQGRGS